jgi:hypothetical protein
MTANLSQPTWGTKPSPGKCQLFRQAVVFLLSAVLWTGCAGPKAASGGDPRNFEFSKDTFSYANGLVWEYSYDANGKWTTRRREPRPTYFQHCFVVSRSACQFFEYARFERSLPKADKDTYRSLIRRVVSTSLHTTLPPDQKIVIPGYADLRSFSRDYEKLLQAECGGVWRCYFQRGNWRMIFPFTRNQQEQVAEQLQQHLQERGAVVVHVARFPSLSINHAVVFFGAKADSEQIDFATYDPNEPGAPTNIRFDRTTKTFYMPYNAYFPGGRVDVYQIYDRFPY